jgi:hypothetical protein
MLWRAAQHGMGVDACPLPHDGGAKHNGVGAEHHPIVQGDPRTNICEGANLDVTKLGATLDDSGCMNRQ